MPQASVSMRKRATLQPAYSAARHEVRQRLALPPAPRPSGPPPACPLRTSNSRPSLPVILATLPSGARLPYRIWMWPAVQRGQRRNGGVRSLTLPRLGANNAQAAA